MVDSSTLLAVDSHVHLYDWANLSHMLDSSLTHFTGLFAAKPGYEHQYGMLVLTEPRARNTFSRLYDEAVKDANGFTVDANWTITPTGEELSLKAEHATGKTVFLVSGQQIITAENLEVLSLVSKQEVEDGLSLADTINSTVSIGGYPVVPWGVGKWLSARGKVVSDVIGGSGSGSSFSIADNGGRPSIWSSIPQFKLAAEHGITLLHGSDPLPVSETRRTAGSCGDIFTTSIDPEKPGESLLKLLADSNCSPAGYGSCESFINFIKDQIALRRK